MGAAGANVGEIDGSSVLLISLGCIFSLRVCFASFPDSGGQLQITAIQNRHLFLRFTMRKRAIFGLALVTPASGDAQHSQPVNNSNAGRG